MCRVSAFRRDMRNEAAEGAASAQHGERRGGTERRGGDMATRFIGGMIAEGLPEIAGAVPAAGGVVVEVDTALEPERYRGADSVDQNRARSKPIPRRGRGRST